MAVVHSLSEVLQVARLCFKAKWLLHIRQSRLVKFCGLSYICSLRCWSRVRVISPLTPTALVLYVKR
jgi:hypothetical protein